jgi:hypothetical protein
MPAGVVAVSESQASDSECISPISYRAGASVGFRAARVADAGGPITSVTYEASDGAVVVVTTYRYDTHDAVEAAVTRLTQGVAFEPAPVRCSQCAPQGTDRRVVFRRPLRGGAGTFGIIRTVDLGLTLVTTQDLVHALDVECLLFTRPVAK